ncbi:hypothetical protein [Streptomyces sp. 1222.5]
MQAHRAGRTPSSRLMARGTVQQAGRVADGTTFTNAIGAFDWPEGPRHRI